MVLSNAKEIPICGGSKQSFLPTMGAQTTWGDHNSGFAWLKIRSHGKALEGIQDGSRGGAQRIFQSIVGCRGKAYAEIVHPTGPDEGEPGPGRGDFFAKGLPNGNVHEESQRIHVSLEFVEDLCHHITEDDIGKRIFWPREYVCQHLILLSGQLEERVSVECTNGTSQVKWDTCFLQCAGLTQRIA